MRLCKVMAGTILVLSVSYGELIEFNPNTPAKASEVNGNFQYLNNGIENLKIETTNKFNNLKPHLVVKVDENIIGIPKSLGITDSANSSDSLNYLTFKSYNGKITDNKNNSFFMDMNVTSMGDAISFESLIFTDPSCSMENVYFYDSMSTMGISGSSLYNIGNGEIKNLYTYEMMDDMIEYCPDGFTMFSDDTNTTLIGDGYTEAKPCYLFTQSDTTLGVIYDSTNTFLNYYQIVGDNISSFYNVNYLMISKAPLSAELSPLDQIINNGNELYFNGENLVYFKLSNNNWYEVNTLSPTAPIASTDLIVSPFGESGTQWEPTITETAKVINPDTVNLANMYYDYSDIGKINSSTAYYHKSPYNDSCDEISPAQETKIVKLKYNDPDITGLPNGMENISESQVSVIFDNYQF